jgi:uracil-DNA glycosylase
MVTDWNSLLGDQCDQPYWHSLQRFLAEERAHHLVYPKPDEVFAALDLTPYDQTKVVILGQDPYHGPGQAHGLSFSVPPGTPIPPSLANIYKELSTDLGIAAPLDGDLTRWARQGVLLLNTTLTVRSGQAGSHQGRGWEHFTDRVIELIAERPTPVVFLLWGAAARRKAPMMSERHHVIESAHPSPLSARRGFFGSRPFSRTNAFLTTSGQTPIDWATDEGRK